MQMNLNGIWRKLCSQFVDGFHGFEDTVEVTMNAVALSQQPNQEAEADDVTELLASHGKEKSAEVLIQPEKHKTQEEGDIATPESMRFTSKDLPEGFSLIEEGVAKFEDENPSMKRYTKAVREVKELPAVLQEDLGGEQGILPD